MKIRALVLLTAMMILCGPAAIGQGTINVWREPLPDGLQVGLRGDEPDAPWTPLEITIGDDTADEFAAMGDVEFAWELRLRAEAMPRTPTIVEQGGVEIQYCPRYLPQLFPEATVGQMCSKDLLESPFLDQGENAANVFRTAFGEIDQMEGNHTDILIKTAIAGAYYWQNRESDGAVDGALRTFLAEERVGLHNALTSIIVEPIVDFLPTEVSGLPPYDELGLGIDLRVTSHATYRSVGDIEGMLRTAAERGLSGIALTDFDHTAGFEHALATADRLKREGILPEDFIVIRGEQVHTPSGALIALFIHDRVQRGMTMKAAIRDIHEQGGIAILADPGIESGPKLVRTLPLDGYLLRTEPGSVFRTLELMGDMGLDKPLLSASGARTHSMVGLPYTIVETSDRSIEGVRQAFRDKTVFGATNIQMPILSALVFRPLVPYEKAFGSWFRMRDRVETKVQKLLGSDNVEIRSSYDEDLHSMLGLVHAPGVINDIIDGQSALTRSPDIDRISADYSYMRIEWNRTDREVQLKGAIRW